jgi:hypothetical protein
MEKKLCQSEGTVANHEEEAQSVQLVLGSRMEIARHLPRRSRFTTYSTGAFDSLIVKCVFVCV